MVYRRKGQVTLPVSAETVWSLVTDLNALHGLGLPSTYGPMPPDPKAGTEFPRLSLHGEGGVEVISSWIPNVEFAFGARELRPDWTYKFQITAINDHACSVVFERVFRSPSPFGRLSMLLGGRDEYAMLLDRTLTALKEASENLAEGRPDGIVRSTP